MRILLAAALIAAPLALPTAGHAVTILGLVTSSTTLPTGEAVEVSLEAVAPTGYRNIIVRDGAGGPIVFGLTGRDFAVPTVDAGGIAAFAAIRTLNFPAFGQIPDDFSITEFRLTVTTDLASGTLTDVATVLAHATGGFGVFGFNQQVSFCDDPTDPTTCTTTMTSGRTEFDLAPVPAPAALAVVPAALVLLGTARRRLRPD